MIVFRPLILTEITYCRVYLKVLSVDMVWPNGTETAATPVTDFLTLSLNQSFRQYTGCGVAKWLTMVQRSSEVSAPVGLGSIPTSASEGCGV